MGMVHVSVVTRARVGSRRAIRRGSRARAACPDGLLGGVAAGAGR
ncbi:hypothetical protein [Actinophytocola oryzae]|uniref:Uncharacterized protein n=1 Tax=Actinophytocola oryzae TaxID=502181 RepID=A0A4R7VG39_9PSEU|nr:hypothetical protein [Actinophytocola oryzae]TDV48008.1 hypothetical protein CLV71_109252 [Actinophytocola oryzae]